MAVVGGMVREVIEHDENMVGSGGWLWIGRVGWRERQDGLSSSLAFGKSRKDPLAILLVEVSEI